MSSTVVTLITWAITTFAPQYAAYLDAALTLMKGAKALADYFGLNKADALKKMASIQFKFTPADAVEQHALKVSGLLEADENHDFAYTMQ